MKLPWPSRTLNATPPDGDNPRMPRIPATPHRSHAVAAFVAAVLTACASPPSTMPQPVAVTSRGGGAGVSMDEMALQQGFARWVAGFVESARAAGVDDATLHTAFDDAHYVPRAVVSDRAQPEFTRAPWDYVEMIVSPNRVEHGQRKLAEMQAPLDAATARYGVPQATVVAIWGMESDYGANFGDIPTIDALATLGFEGRREAWARGQLMAALKILQSGDIDRAHMIGSWAGAMGQTQFIPTAFLSFAVDADGDGRRDIWGSMADVAASTANFLARSGWQTGQPWGAEVKLPDGFDPARADDGVRQASAQWAAEGVQAMDGSPLPEIAEARSCCRRALAARPSWSARISARAALQQRHQLRAGREPAGAAHRRRAGRAGHVASRRTGAVARPGQDAAVGPARPRVSTPARRTARMGPGDAPGLARSGSAAVGPAGRRLPDARTLVDAAAGALTAARLGAGRTASRQAFPRPVCACSSYDLLSRPRPW